MTGKYWREACRVTGVIQPGSLGHWSVRTFEVGEYDIRNLRYMLDGRATRTGTYTQLVHDRRGVVMSDTDAEIGDMRDLFYRKPSGRVLVNGLGLGCVVRGLLSIPDVTHLDVVEIDKDVIELVGSQLSDPRLTIHNADAFTIQWPKGTTWDCAWHDVWDNLCIDNLSSEYAEPGSYATLHRKYARKVGWQESWGFDFLQRERDRERKSRW